jgi:phenylpropionate dioxygenase-like ring-hydroxylating dioxygenase large terminal subunit
MEVSGMAKYREASINYDYWWPIAHINDFKNLENKSLRVGNKELLIIKISHTDFSVHADYCPHKRVRLSKYGKIDANNITCHYHDWCFDKETGDCNSIGTMIGETKNFNLETYPSKVYANFIWVYLSDRKDIEAPKLPQIKPFDLHDSYYQLPMQGRVNAHYSFITENATDLYHAKLHELQQPWLNPKLVEIDSNEDSVKAKYEVETPSSLGMLFSGDETKYVKVEYNYPYIHIYEEKLRFYLFVTYIPDGPKSTKVISTFYFKHFLNSKFLSKLLEPILIPILDHFSFRRVFKEDIEPVEEEQRAYDLNGTDLSRELNKVTHQVRQLLVNKTQGQEILLVEPSNLRPGEVC